MGFELSLQKLLRTWRTLSVTICAEERCLKSANRVGKPWWHFRQSRKFSRQREIGAGALWQFGEMERASAATSRIVRRCANERDAVEVMYKEYQVPSTQYSVLSTRVLGTRHSALGTRYSALGTRHSVLGTRYSALGTRYSVPNPQSPDRVRSDRRERITLTLSQRERGKSTWLTALPVFHPLSTGELIRCGKTRGVCLSQVDTKHENVSTRRKWLASLALERRNGGEWSDIAVNLKSGLRIRSVLVVLLVAWFHGRRSNDPGAESASQATRLNERVRRGSRGEVVRS